jgi:hypothetical protein
VLARWQDRLEVPWRGIAHGCRPNRATAESIERAGYVIGELERGRLPKAMPLVRPMISGTAARG